MSDKMFTNRSVIGSPGSSRERTFTESDINGNSVQRLKLGWACYYRRAYDRHLDRVEWFEFETASAFWAFVFSHTEAKRKLWVIACNINFDFTIVDGWKNLQRERFKLKFFHCSGSCCIISVRSKSGSIIFIDSLNWFRESVESLGRRLGVPKLKIDFQTADRDSLSRYCKRDVEILLAAFKDFVGFLDVNRISRLCYTIASTAMAAYLFGYYDHKIYIHNNSEAIDLERKSYRGGRCECFYLGIPENGPFYLLDVNSLYATVMYHFAYPIRYQKIFHKMSLRDLRQSLKTKSVIADCLIDCEEPAYAVRRKRTIFPTGKFWVTLTTPELVYALKNDHIVEVRDAVVYSQARIFQRYVKRFYDLRLEFKKSGMVTYVEICKLLLNSLYGKFGQKAEIWEKIGVCPGEKNRVEICFTQGPGPVGQIRYLLGEIWELTGWSECFNSFPAIASQVAAYARMYLYDLMKTAGRGNYYYCDTDSLIVNSAGLSNLSGYLSDTNLGCLKVEETSSTLDIRGLKDYSTDAKTVIKGIRKNAVEISEGVFTQEQWPSLQGLLRTGQTDSYTVKQTTKTLTREYTKGVHGPDGWVRPFSLDESYQGNLWRP